MMGKIGLTGGICTGKTYVLQIFKELNCFTLRADEIAKQILLSNNSDISKKIIAEFGESIYDKQTGIKKDELQLRKPAGCDKCGKC